MGYFRFLLAITVALSHLGWNPFGLQPGVSAVVCFLALSGFVMTGLIERYYYSVAAIPAFYFDRAARIFPQFFLYLTLALLLFSAGVIVGPNMLSACSSSQLALNFLGLPLGFYMFAFPTCVLDPPTWSIGLELSFYLIFPLLLLFKWRVPAVLVSLIFFSFAYDGIIDTNIYGYRLLPGVLFIFVLGSLIFTSDNKFERGIVISVFFLAAGALYYTVANPALAQPYNRSVLFGIIVAVPAVFLLKYLPTGKLDAWAGHLSYGIFLNHFLLLMAFGVAPMIVLPGSVLLAALSYHLVERPVIRWRHRLRNGRLRLKTAPAIPMQRA